MHLGAARMLFITLITATVLKEGEEKCTTTFAPVVAHVPRIVSAGSVDSSGWVGVEGVGGGCMWKCIASHHLMVC